MVSEFDRIAHEHAAKPAVFWGEDEISYGSIQAKSARLARHLLDQGVQAGDRVGIWMKNRPEFIVALYGIMRAGGVAVPVNNFLKPDEVSFIASDAGFKACVSEEGMKDGLAIVGEANPAMVKVFVESIESLPEATMMGSDRKRDELAVIIYTSGTTGKPKGAMLSHGNLLHNVASCRDVLAVVEGDRFALLLPMFHSFMLCVCIVLPLSVGATIVLVKSLHPPKNIIQEIVIRKATILPCIPQLFRTLAANPPGIELPLRLCVSGAAPLPAEILKEFGDRLGIPLLEGYGLSEASPVVSMNPIDGKWKPGSIGIPIPGVEVKIVDDAGKELPAEEAGELCVRGGNVMQGYWNKPEATASTIKEDWLYTGDVARKDSDGYIYITDRKKDMLLVNGINVYPREIEEVLYSFEGVKEAAVVGQKDKRRGELPVAFVSLNEGVTIEPEKIVDYVRGKMADYKVPRKVFVLDALPKNATGKILKTDLRDRPEVQV